MSDLASWHATNTAYLSAAIGWLRLLLWRHAPEQPAAAPVVAADARATPRTAESAASAPWWSFRRGEPAAPAPSPRFLALPPLTTTVSEAQVAEALERVRAAEASDPPPAMSLLAHRLGLTPFERDVLLLCVAMELDTQIAALCARAQDAESRGYPTFALAMAIFEGASWDALSPERPLRYWRLIEMPRGASQRLTASELYADERVVHFVKGMPEIDERLAMLLMPLQAREDALLSVSQQAIVDEIGRAIERDQPNLRPFQLLGDDSHSKLAIAHTVAKEAGIMLYRVAADALPSQPADLESVIRLLQREAQLLPVGVVIETGDVDRGNDVQAGPLRRFLARASGLTFIDAHEPWPTPTPSHVVEVGRPTPDEQREAWLAATNDAEAAARLAGQFNLGMDAIARIAADGAAETNEEPLVDRLWRRCVNETRMRVEGLAQRIDARAEWKHLVLPKAETQLLEHIASQVAGRSQVYDEWGFRGRVSRGLGISALFAGESGTGKTLAAEVLAHHLKLPLYRIDLSTVVSKWVGETEKNTRRIFDAAENGGGILFFDEADALFGKRTEVQHSQDRFANIEINFLLQRMEAYRGLVILATNLKSALDTAFVRRLRFIVNFPYPGRADRERIWRGIFPDGAPVDELDFARLASLNVAGGSVQNIALTAAFLASSRKSRITMAVVLDAARLELRKLEKDVDEADFRLPEPLQVTT